MTENLAGRGEGLAGRWRKKPVVIDAAQWFKNGDHPLDYSKNHEGFADGALTVFTASERKEKGWEGDIVRYFRRPDVSDTERCQHCSGTMHVHGWIDTKEGGHIVCPGDWIITGVQGENYPCKPDIFEATYEPAALEAAAPPSTRSKDRQGNFVERSKVVARQICEHLNVPYDRYGWLPDYLQNLMLAIDEEALVAALATPSPQAPPTAIKPFCIGYPNCDGDLEGEEHSERCRKALESRAAVTQEQPAGSGASESFPYNDPSTMQACAERIICKWLTGELNAI